MEPGDGALFVFSPVSLHKVTPSFAFVVLEEVGADFGSVVIWCVPLEGEGIAVTSDGPWAQRRIRLSGERREEGGCGSVAFDLIEHCAEADAVARSRFQVLDAAGKGRSKEDGFESILGSSPVADEDFVAEVIVGNIKLQVLVLSRLSPSLRNTPLDEGTPTSHIRHLNTFRRILHQSIN